MCPRFRSRDLKLNKCMGTLRLIETGCHNSFVELFQTTRWEDDAENVSHVISTPVNKVPCCRIDNIYPSDL